MLDGLFGQVTQLAVKGNSNASPGAPVEDFPLLYCLAGHFFQAKGLGAELDVIVVPFSFLAVFVFDGSDLLVAGGWVLVVGGYFDEVGKTGDVQAVGPDPEAAVDGTALFVCFGAGTVGTGLVLVGAFEHGRVYFDFTLHIHVPETARTVDDLVEVGKWQIGFHCKFQFDYSKIG